MQLSEDADFCPQHFRDYRHRDIVDRAALISLQAVSVRQVDGGNKNDRGSLKSRVLADNFRQLESIQVRHADIHQHYGDIRPEQDLQGLFPRVSLDKMLPQVGQHHFIGQQFGRLIVHHQDIDFFGAAHLSGLSSL